jgi:hypothetical protein
MSSVKLSRRWLYSILAFGLIMAMGSVAYALGTGFEANDLSRWVLQANELPQDFQVIMNHELTAKTDAQRSPLEMGDFLKGYRLDGLYPYLGPDRTHGKFYILNLVYRYSSKEQAMAQFEHKLKEVESTVDNVKISSIGYDESLLKEYGVSGQALSIQIERPEGSPMIYWFLGVKDRTLVLLMLDNWSPEIADTEVLHVFESLVEPLLQR